MRLTPRAPHRPTPTAAPARRTPHPGARVWLAVPVAVFLVGLVSAGPAHAETTQVLALAASLTDVITNVRNWVVGILATLATGCLTVGGLRYLWAATHGDVGEIQAAKRMLKAAAVGYGVVALAPLIVTLLGQMVGA